MNEQDWFSKGTYREVFGHQIFVIDSAVNEVEGKSKPVLCLLHGFPTSSFDYWKVFDQLAIYFRVIVHDHLGFGFSDKPIDYSYSLIDQTDIALKLWQLLGVTQANVLAHDYGTSIMTELIVRDNQGSCPIRLQQLVLCNGSIHIELAHLRLMQRLLRNQLIGPLVAKLSSEGTLRRNLKAIYSDPTKISQTEVKRIWKMMTFNQGKKVLPLISQYTFERKKLWHRWIGAIRKTELPIEIIWPDSDPIAVPAMAQVIHQETKNSRLVWLNKVGHFPMLEDPEQWSRAVLQSLEN